MTLSMTGAVARVQVKAFDRKGVQFFRFSTPVSSDIIHLEVVNSTLYAFAEYSVTVFEETTEKSFYLAPERITCATIVPMRGTDGHMAALGCQDSCIRLLDGNQVVQVSGVVRSGAERAVVRCMSPQHPQRPPPLPRSVRAAFDHTPRHPAGHAHRRCCWTRHQAPSPTARSHTTPSISIPHARSSSWASRTATLARFSWTPPLTTLAPRCRTWTAAVPSTRCTRPLT